MVAIFVVGTLVQLAAAALALLSIPLSGKHYAWVLLSCGLVLQIWRRVYLLFDGASGSRLHEGVSALVVSVFMLLSVVGIRSIFRSMIETSERLRIEQGRTQEYVDLTEALVVGLDRAGRIALINRAGARTLGGQKDALLGEEWHARFVPPERSDGERELFEKFMLGTAEPIEVFETPIVTIDGERRSVVWHKAIQRDKEGHITGTLAFGTDVTERREAEAAVEHLTHHDVLTGLPGRALFEQRAELMMASARQDGTPLALLFFDVDDLKGVNDRYGRPVADHLLWEFADRITEAFPDQNTVARLGGDEFCVLLSVHDTAEADAAAEKAREALRQPYRLYGKEIWSTASVGIAWCPKDARDVEGLLWRGDAAARKARRSGGNSQCRYVSGMRGDMIRRLSLRHDLAAAVAAEQFVLHYQPQVRIDTGDIVGAEALIRWNRPDHGLMAPANFIPVLEEIGLIETVGEWVTREACAQAVAWQEDGFRGLRMSVNASVGQFRGKDFLGVIRDALDSTGLDPHDLQIEITETMAIEDIHEALELVAGINAIGASVAIDDFGTGHSQLVYLKRFPVRTVKIDRAFIMDLEASESDQVLVSSMIALAHGLHFEVVAEGIETEGQLALLQDYGCDCAQGFLCRPPLAVDEFAAFLKAHARAPHRVLSGSTSVSACT